MSGGAPAAHIALIGMMGSGKTTLARLLGKRLALPVADTDALAAKAAGMTVADIINTRGEAEFRRCECAALRQALAAPRQVIATGGGIVLDADNRAALRAAAQVVHLQVAADMLLARVQKNPGKRPLLSGGGDIDEKIRELLAVREKFYAQTAHHIITQNPSEKPARVADKIIYALQL